MGNEALTAAHELLPLITRLRDETESGRCLAPPIVTRLRETRLCRMFVAARLQGLELPPPETLDVYEALASAEASVAWIVWNNGLPCLLARFLESDARQEVFGDPQWLYAISTRPTGRAAIDGEGYRINGRWSLVSGCELAEWIALNCVIEENGGPRMIKPGEPELRFVYVRRSDCQILDTWYSGGLRGTGSHDIVVKDKYVPHYRTVSPRDRSSLDGPIGRVPMICTMVSGFGAQTLGVAQSALDTLVEMAKTKARFDAGPALGERPAVLASIARQSAALEAARAYLRACLTRLWDSVCAGEEPSLADITAVWGAAHHAAEQSRNTIETMFAAGGATSLYTSCPLERAHRDFHAMLRHVVAQSFWLENAGLAKLGMNPTHPLYAV